MNIHISNVSGKALYEQIYDQIKNQILEGTLCKGKKHQGMLMYGKEASNRKQ